MAKIAVTVAGGQLGAEIVKAAVEVVGKGNVLGLSGLPAERNHWASKSTRRISISK